MNAIHPAILILAAGSSSRLGRSKQLLEIEGESLIARAVRVARESRIGPIYVVIAAGDDAVEHELRKFEIECDAQVRGLRFEAGGSMQSASTHLTSNLKPATKFEAIHILTNSSPQLGIGSSIKIGVHHIAQTAADSVLIMLCDQPRITSELLNQLIVARQNRIAAACSYGQTIGVPAVFGRELFGELSEISDESGAKVVLDRHKGSIAKVDFPAAELDVDTAEDFKAMKQKLT